MGKTVEDLKLRDEGPGIIQDVRETLWYQSIEQIDQLLATGEYTWAEDTLTDIQRTIEQTKTVTDGQRKAIENIEAARTGSHGRSSQRRYEGFRGRRW
jgi:hypothetical protein